MARSQRESARLRALAGPHHLEAPCDDANSSEFWGRRGGMAASRTRPASQDSAYRLDYSWFSLRRLYRHLFIL